MRIKAIASLAFAISLASAAPALRSRDALKAPLTNKNLRILPLGDSITWGYHSTDENGYRGHLYDRLVSANNTVDMLGSQHNGDMSDNDNEGHPGWVISQIAGAAADVSDLDPNVVLLHAGTNDCNNGLYVDTAYARLAQLLDQITTGWPDAAILVAQIIPAKNETTNAAIDAYNAKIPDVVRQRVDDGKHLFMVNMSSPGIAVNDLSDGLHPSDEGYIKMADLWHTGLEGAYALGLLDFD